MNSKFLKLINYLSEYDFNMKDNYEIYRALQEKKPLSKKSQKIIEDNITFYLFSPKKYKTNKTIIYLHGGGWTIGSVKYYSFTLGTLANELKRNIITFDYPLAPEHPYPEGIKYCYEAIKTIFKKAKEYQIDTKDIMIMGDSAGANLATSICIKAKETKDFKIKKEILLYPIVQTNFKNNKKFKSIEENGYNYFLTKKMIKDYLELYLVKKENYKSIYASPLNAKWLFNMPETLIITADLDPLRDEGYAYAKKLRRYFNQVTYYNMKNVIHGFFNNPFYFKENHHVIKIIKKFVGDKIE